MLSPSCGVCLFTQPSQENSANPEQQMKFLRGHGRFALHCAVFGELRWLPTLPALPQPSIGLTCTHINLIDIITRALFGAAGQTPASPSVSAEQRPPARAATRRLALRRATGVHVHSCASFSPWVMI